MNGGLWLFRPQATNFSLSNEAHAMTGDAQLVVADQLLHHRNPKFQAIRSRQ